MGDFETWGNDTWNVRNNSRIALYLMWGRGHNAGANPMQAPHGAPNAVFSGFVWTAFSSTFPIAVVALAFLFLSFLLYFLRTLHNATISFQRTGKKSHIASIDQEWSTRAETHCSNPTNVRRGRLVWDTWEWPPPFVYPIGVLRYVSSTSDDPIRYMASSAIMPNSLIHSFCCIPAQSFLYTTRTKPFHSARKRTLDWHLEVGYEYRPHGDSASWLCHEECDPHCHGGGDWHIRFDCWCDSRPSD
jgi:hypothetical protein